MTKDDGEAFVAAMIEAGSSIQAMALSRASACAVTQTSLSRQSNVLEEHRELIACIRNQDAKGAARAIGRHVEGSGRHIIERMRLDKRQG